MTESHQEDFTELMRHAAREEIDSLKLIRATMWDEHTHTYRWMMASLLAVNGAACLGVLGQESISLSYKLTAGSIFVFGILSSLLVALFGQRSAQKSLVPLQQLIGYWTTVSLDGERDEEQEVILTNQLSNGLRTARAARFAGWVSAVVDGPTGGS